jgi:endoglucanase
MKTIKSKLLLIGFFIIFSYSNAQTPFDKGVNLSGWFQAGNAHQLQLTKYTKKDFANIKSLGCDVIRLPINLFYMTNGKPDYVLDKLFLQFLDQAVSWAEEYKIYLILDNHSTDDIASKNPSLESALTKVWTQMAEHYKDRSEYIIYEIMNEPNGISTQTWGTIQQKGIDAIRSVDTKHYIIVGASNFNTYNELNQLPQYTDNKLIYTFHFYDPFIFTHQGASWPNPSLEKLINVPYPYNASTMPSLPGNLAGTWIQNAYNSYSIDGTLAKIKSLIDIAVAFKNSRNINLYCGEFGVYIPYSDNTQRCLWYNQVKTYLEEKGISWTTWDYQGGFGLFKKGSNELFDYDLNIPLIQALGLTEPAQKVFELKSDSVGFNIYSDYIAENIFESGYASGGTIDYYSSEKPNNGNYCIYWTGSPQYAAIGFNFIPDKNLTRLKSENYALSFCVRGNSPGTNLELRFLDTKTTDPNDHPWRMNYTLSGQAVQWDGKWHKVYIPLSSFSDQGSWDNSTWYNPVGAFDWKAIDRFEITTDQGALTNKKFWFDNIYIVNMDTARVFENSIYLSVNDANLNSNKALTDVSVFPNPANQNTNIAFSLSEQANVKIGIYNLSGQKIKTLLNNKHLAGEYNLDWNLCDESGHKVKAGIYICQFIVEGKQINPKTIIVSD